MQARMWYVATTAENLPAETEKKRDNQSLTVASNPAKFRNVYTGI